MENGNGWERNIVKTTYKRFEYPKGEKNRRGGKKLPDVLAGIISFLKQDHAFKKTNSHKFFKRGGKKADS